MALNINPVNNHREREKGVIVYPVYSRRSEGLSIGINLFPDRKNCTFDCPYCEVFPFFSQAKFSLEQMENDLRPAINNAVKNNILVKDICFSGNGEPTLSPAFIEAFKLAENIRSEISPSSRLVVITNGTGLLNEKIFTFIKEINNSFLDIWLKLDAGTPDWFNKINRSSVKYEELIGKIKEITLFVPVIIQTMLCSINGKQPSEIEEKKWEYLICHICEKAKGKIRKIQIYGKARPAPEDPLACVLPAEYLEKRGVSLRRAFIKKGIITPVDVYL